jgi:hypothetical protein
MKKTIRKLAGLGIALFTIAFAPFAKADQWDKTTLITTHEPIQIQGQILEPGEHVMRLLNTVDRRTLEIYGADGNKLVMIVMALPAYRLEPTGDTQFTFSEVSPSGAPALHTWFYPGDNFGLEFVVKH